MGKLSDHPDFEEVGGVTFYVGKSDPPTAEQWDAYLASAPDEKTRDEWAKHRPEAT